MISLSDITRKERISIILIAISYIAGFLAHHTEGNIAELFRLSTPLYLSGLCIWTLAFHREKKRRWILVCVVILMLSILIEIIGVKTGWPFGQYYYGNALGPKLLGVPLVIGFNWLLLVYSSLILTRQVLKKSILLQCLVASALVVLLDVHIEGIAPKLDYWYFKENPVPTINFIAWFVLCFVFQWALVNSAEQRAFDNRVAPFTFIFMFLYFMMFYLI